MHVRVATFNLNNLFSRFNFSGGLGESPIVSEGGITISFGENDFKVRTFMGRLVKGKHPDDTTEIAKRIKDVVNADVLAVQEVEHIGILKEFNRDFLDGMYPYLALVEGNDRRLIDVGIMSKLPIGTIVSHQTATHPDDPSRRVFGRDLLQVEILDENSKKLFTIYNTHLKSHFVPHTEDPVQGAIDANNLRNKQAETIARIIGKMEHSSARFVLTGDMNDPPESEFLEPMLTVDGKQLVNTLVNPAETRPAKPETPGQGDGPQSNVWTHRFNPPGPELPRYELFDQIWVSQALSEKYSNPTIDRRTKHSGDGSDHDPAWIDLEL
jgi:endonuclease/exonuclease/phosphatase family metal-dependent hydrolase